MKETLPAKVHTSNTKECWRKIPREPVTAECWQTSMNREGIFEEQLETFTFLKNKQVHHRDVI